MRTFVLITLALFLSSCGLSKKTVSKLEYANSISASQSKTTLTTEYYGDMLSGSMNIADSADTDSATFESAGLKLKVKVSKNGTGGKKIDFQAEAKPVARSTLTDEKTNIDLKEKLSKREKEKETTSPGGWVWLIAIIIIAIVILLIRRSLK